MKVNFYSTFREHAGVKTATISAPEDATIRWIISKVLEEFPGLNRLWLDKSGALHGHVHISLNQVDVMALPNQLDTVVKEEDVVDFFPPITGG